MQGKRVLVTGATDGIGKVAAIELAKMGAEVIIVGRDAIKTRKVMIDLKQASGSTRVDMLLADLSSMADVRAVAEEFLSRHERLDVLLNNAGAYFAEYRTSADGYEMTFALNHLAYYLLTALLLDALKATAQEKGEARIVNVSSSAHRSGQHGFQEERLRDGGGYRGLNAYSESKLANILFTYELARQLEGSGVTANALHPGLVATAFGHNNSGFMTVVLKVLQKVFGRSPKKGAETLIYLASSAEVDGISGKYWSDRQQKRSNEASYSQDLQRRLWERSAEITGVG